jgi:hypothetical protein
MPSENENQTETETQGESVAATADTLAPIPAQEAGPPQPNAMEVAMSVPPRENVKAPKSRTPKADPPTPTAEIVKLVPASKKPTNWKTWAAIAAGVALVAIGGVAVARSRSAPPPE